MNTCLRVLKETKWILSFLTCLKFIEYFPDYLSALSRRLLRFFGQPLSKQLYLYDHKISDVNHSQSLWTEHVSTFCDRK